MGERDALCATCKGPVRHHLNDTGTCPSAPYIARLQKRLNDVLCVLRTTREGLQYQAEALADIAQQARRASEELRRR